MNYPARKAAATAYEKVTGEAVRPKGLGYSSEGTFRDTGEKWIEYFVKGDDGHHWIRVCNESDGWTAIQVIGPDGKEVAA